MIMAAEKQVTNFSASSAESAHMNAFSLREMLLSMRVAWDSDLVVAKYCIYSIARQGFFPLKYGA